MHCKPVSISTSVLNTITPVGLKYVTKRIYIYNNG